MAIGGARECLFVEPGLLNIILDRRMGFIRVAMETGEPLSICLAASTVQTRVSRPYKGTYCAVVHHMHGFGLCRRIAGPGDQLRGERAV